MTVIWMDSYWACTKFICKFSTIRANYFKDSIHFCWMYTMKMHRVLFFAIIYEMDSN